MHVPIIDYLLAFVLQPEPSKETVPMNKAIPMFSALMVYSMCHAQEIPLSNDWFVQDLPASAAHVGDGAVDLTPK